MAVEHEEAPVGAAAPGPDDAAQAVSNHHGRVKADSAMLRAEVDRHDKRFATLCAELARRGYQLYIVNINGAATYLIARWDRSRELSDLTAVEMFLRQIGA